MHLRLVAIVESDRKQVKLKATSYGIAKANIAARLKGSGMNRSDDMIAWFPSKGNVSRIALIKSVG